MMKDSNLVIDTHCEVCKSDFMIPYSTHLENDVYCDTCKSLLVKKGELVYEQ
jgi:hypothetical protein